MSYFLKLLKPWEKLHKKIYICCSNEPLKQTYKQLYNNSVIINANIKVVNNNSYREYHDKDCDFYIIPTIKKNCNSKIYIDNIGYNNPGLILQDAWDNPDKKSILLLQKIYDFTSPMFNIFFTHFFNNIQSNNINIYINIIDQYSKLFLEIISNLTIFYNSKPVQFNCLLGLPPIKLNLKENNFLIVRLQKLFNNPEHNTVILAKRINLQEIYDNANNVTILYFEIMEDASNFYGNNNNFKQLISLFEYFIDIPIYLT